MTNTAISVYKLMKLIGTPDWFESVSSEPGNDGIVFIKLTVNTKKCIKELASVPTEVDGVKIRIFYQNPIRKYYKQELRRYYSSKSIPQYIRYEGKP